MGPLPGKVVLEAGSGPGTLTEPLLSLIQGKITYVCYDLYGGVYSSFLSQLQKRMLQCSEIQGDVRNMAIRSDSIDCVLSHKLLCELSAKDILPTMKEIYRILSRGGMYINGVLSPFTLNRSQELVLLADSHSTNPLFEKSWFSPPADTLAGMLYCAGFSHIMARYMDISIRFQEDCAFQQLDTWNTDAHFYDLYADEVKKHGLEFPLIQIISCCK